MREGGGGSRLFDRNDYEGGMHIFVFLLRWGLYNFCNSTWVSNFLSSFSPPLLIITRIFRTSKYLGKGSLRTQTYFWLSLVSVKEEAKKPDALEG